MGFFFFNPPLLFLYPILVVHRRRRLHLSCPIQVKSYLFPQPHPHPLPPLPLRRLTQVQNWPRRNIMHDRILPSLNVGLHHIKHQLLSRRLHQGVLPSYVQPPPCQTPRQSPCHLILETPQDPSHVGGNHPRICTKEQH